MPQRGRLDGVEDAVACLLEPNCKRIGNERARCMRALKNGDSASVLDFALVKSEALSEAPGRSLALRVLLKI